MASLEPKKPFRSREWFAAREGAAIGPCVETLAECYRYQ